jgi:hypothetical protein
MEEFVRIVIVPISIMLGGFLLEVLAIRAKGTRRGPHKFKAWLRRPDGSLHSDSPCSITQIEGFVRRSHDKLVDIVELASFESYSGLSFDLCIAALTADIIAIFNAQQALLAPSRIALVVAIHFLLLVIVVLLVTANQSMAPRQPDDAELHRGAMWYSWLWRSWWYSTSKRRIVLAVLAGLMTLVTSFIVLWEAL